MNQIEEMYEEHLETEPKNYSKIYDDDIKIQSDQYIRWSIIRDNLKSVVDIDPEKRQKILDRFKKGGISIGGVADLFEEDSMAVGNLIYFNIKSASFLVEESV